MKTSTMWKRHMVVVGLGVFLFGVSAHWAVSDAIAAGPMAHAELSGSATVTMRKLNSADSCDASIHANAELFHPGTSQVEANWAPTGHLNIGRYDHTATLLPDGKVLVAGGRGSDNCFAPTNSAELYDPVTGTWTPTGSLNTARIGHTATLLKNGFVLLAGGYGDINEGHFDSPLNSAELYDPAAGTWHPTGSFATIRYPLYDSITPAAPLLPNGRVLVVGDTSASDFNAELYDPNSGTWSSTSSRNTLFYSTNGMVLLPNGKVLGVSGGCDYVSGCSTGSELYDPATEQWSTAGSLINFSPTTMTLLRNGNVLVTGFGPIVAPEQATIYDTSRGTWIGTGNLTFSSWEGGAPYEATMLADGQVLVSGKKGAELYDSITGTWSRTRPPTVPRYYHTATLLLDGTTLIAGGIDDGLVSPPSITSVQVLKKGRPIPAIIAGTKAKKLSLVVFGLDFDSEAELLVNGEALELAGAGSRVLVGRFTKQMVRTPGELSIQVRNSSGKISNTVTVLVVAGQ